MMNALGRCTLDFQIDWAASGAGITGTLAAFFISLDNNYRDLRPAPEPRNS